MYLNARLERTHFHVAKSAFWFNRDWISHPEGNAALGAMTGQGLCNA